MPYFHWRRVYGLDSLGLVHTAPRRPAGRVLDLCTGSGVHALVASRYADRVVAVDRNPRAVRFARFNAGLNGAENVTVVAGDLYAPVAGERFDLILANPPFVPSPVQTLAFRDGGSGGEEVLRRIVREAGGHLTAEGRLHIVTDLADVGRYADKLRGWWDGGGVRVLLLHTADRDERLFSIPHAHHPFGQGFDAYAAELASWVGNFREAGLHAVNFGYILLHRRPEGGFELHERVIHSPRRPIHRRVAEHFEALAALAGAAADARFPRPDPQLLLRREGRLSGGEERWEVTVADDPWFTTYVVDEAVVALLRELAPGTLRLGELDPRRRVAAEALVRKGLCRLEAGAPTTGAGPAGPAEPPAPAIAELASKTTPTCLSSYLR